MNFDKTCSCQLINILLLYDNAQWHSRIGTKETIALFGWVTLLPPSFSPDLAPLVYHHFGPMKEVLRGKHEAGDEEIKTAVIKWLKNSQQNFTRKRYMLSFKSGTLLLGEMLTMLRSRDVIHRGPA